MKFKPLKSELAVVVAMALLLVVGLCVGAQAQDKKAAKQDTPLANIVLTQDEAKEAVQVQEKVNAAIEKAQIALQAAQANVAAAQASINSLKNEFNLYVSQVALKKKVDPDKYETQLAALDEKGEFLGFRPKVAKPPGKAE